MMEDILDKIAELLRESNLGWAVHWGDPQTNPQWDLPYVSVCPYSETEAVWTMGSTMGTGGRNKANIGVSAYVVVGITPNFRSADIDSPMDRDLVQQAEKVKAVLRENLTLDGQVFTYNSIAVQYRTGVRGSEGIRVAQVNVTYEVGRTR